MYISGNFFIRYSDFFQVYNLSPYYRVLTSHDDIALTSDLYKINEHGHKVKINSLDH